MAHLFRFSPALLALALVAAVALVSASAFVGQAREECSVETLVGPYGFTDSGTAFIPGPGGQVNPVQVVVLGRFVADGEGHLAGTDTSTVGGQIARGNTFSGTYVVHADCTGSDTLTLQPQNMVIHHDFVIVDKGRELMSTHTDPGSVFTGKVVRQ